MRVVVTGGAGFLGRLLIRRLLERGDEVVAFDASPGGPSQVEYRHGDLTDPGVVADLLGGDGPLSVFHLAAMVSGGCERDPDGAYAVNVEGLHHILEALRHRGAPSRLVVTSSVAVYGNDAAGTEVDDDARQVPTTTYGMTKAIGELMVNDYSRKGFVDGRTVRLPTVVIRAGAANAAVSSFASAVVREPAAGQAYVLPVAPDTPVAVIGYREAIDGLVAVHDLDGDRLGVDRSLSLSSVTVTPADLLAALQAQRPATGTGAVTVEVDDQIQRIADGWPAAIRGSRARALGIRPSTDAAALVRAYLEDFG
jgi:nucleoside-diphosphate-sugar epimerase